ncbi:Protein MAM3 [Erysiphe neolycopersici]|uniref:Protein MAM3 n=1 Tax=Erysiphe neolycopersici TaxID=212602 RepID=A0A420H6R8_9PEZI|nr:Protein MAM3 [Erysiphe neolycopersici]
MSFGHSAPSGHTKQIYSRPSICLLKTVLFVFAQASHALVIPLTQYFGVENDDVPAEAELSIWLYLAIAAVLVLAGGAFAGLTIALMGQDGVYLQVIATSGEGTQQRHAKSVHNLLQRGKHWVLVTLLLSNVIVNETLPIVLDRSLGGGWPAVLGSTVLIVIFGEVIPQSVCVRYGLSIGAFMAPCVLALMWVLAPIAWPIAKLLDILLGKDHGTVYKKSGLKTLVRLHKTLGSSPTERLNQDEVTIISAVLDLKEKAVGDIMTPIDNVFTMSEDTILNEEKMNTILSAGYSRIPIYKQGNPNHFIGMLLVKILITYDPEDCKRVSEFALASLPATRPETSCLDIVNFFQEGKSHMVLVSENPAENYGAIGVVTLEDVIEELIGEEIIDESDVYIDVHKAIKRLAPAPKARTQKRHVINTGEVATQTVQGGSPDNKGYLSRNQNDTLINENPTAPSHTGNNPEISLI